MKTPSTNARLVAAAALAMGTAIVSADTLTTNLSPTADARVINESWGVNTNYGTDPNISVYQSRDRSLLRFAVPVGATVNSASLTLTATDTLGGNPNGESMDLYRLTGGWTEGTVTWNTQPSYDGTLQATSTANPGTGQTITWDVTSLASQWAGETVANNGLLIINSGTTNGLHFASKENGAVAYRPYLATNFTTPTSAPAGSYTWSGGTGNWSGTDMWLDGATPVTWVDNKDAVIGSGGDTAGTITISGTVTPRTLWFQGTGSGNYTVGGGTIDLGGAMRIVDVAQDSTIASGITNGGIFKQGAGKLALAGSNTSAGGMIINGGTVEATRSMQDDGIHTLGTGTITINDGGTLRSTRNWTTSSEWNGTTVGAITINQGGTWSIEGVGQTIRNGLFLNGGSITATVTHGDWGALHLKSGVTAGGNAVSSIAAQTALSGSQTITVGGGSQLNYSGAIIDQVAVSSPGSVRSGITKAGAGTLVLSGDNSYTGVTTLEGGVLNAASFANNGTNSSIGAGTGDTDGNNIGLLFRGGTLQYTGSTAQSTDRAIRLSTTGGGGTIDASGGNASATLNFTRASSPNLWENGGNRTLTLTGSNTGDNTFAMAINDLSGVTTVNVTKSGLGKWVLSGNSNYLGVTEIQAGTLVAASGTALGTGGWSSSTMTWIRDGATLALQGGITLDEHMHVFGAGVGGLGAIRSLSGNNALTLMYNGGGSGPGFSIDSNTTVGVDADTLTLTGFYESNGNWGLTKVGAGTLVLTQVSTYTGGTTVDDGTLSLAGSGGNGRIQGALTVNANGTVVTTGDGTGFGYNNQLTALTINGGTVKADASDSHIWNIASGVSMTGGELQTNAGVSDATGNAFQWNRTALTTNASADTAVISGRVNLRGDSGYSNWAVSVADGAADTDLLVSAAITNSSGAVGITKSGAGTMVVTGDNTYTGGTNVQGGTLTLSGSGQINSGGASLAIGGGATFRIQDTATATFNDLNIGDANGSAGHVVQTGGTLNVTGNSGESAGVRVGHWPNESSTYTLSGGTLNITANLALGTDGSGTFTQTGGTLNTAGIAVNQRNGLGNGIFNLEGGTANIGAGGIFTDGAPYAVNLGGGTLGALTTWSSSLDMTLTGTNGNVTFDTTGGDITLGGILGGSGGLTKAGSGSLWLGAANGYTGTTTVAAGNLILNGGTIASSTTIDVQAGASLVALSGNLVLAGQTLTGKGTVELFGGNTLLLTNNSILGPGASPGTLSVTGNLFLDNSTYQYEAAGGGLADLTAVNGNLDFGASVLLNFLNTGAYVTGDELTLFAYSGLLTGTFDGYADDTQYDLGGTTWQFNYDDSTPGLNGDGGLTGAKYVTLTYVIPEPSAAALGLLAATGLLLRRRRTDA